MLNIVSPTFAKREYLANLLFEYLGSTWPNHPKVWFITDGEGIRHPDTVRVVSPSWVVRLHEGLKKVKGSQPELTHVFLLLEDNFPLWPCDTGHIEKMAEVAQRDDLNCITFMPPTGFTVEKQIDTGHGFLMEVPKSYLYYSQVQPSIWKYDHLMETCEMALRDGISDCWQFEYLVTGGHYISEYTWPTLLDGIYSRGFINPRAVKLIRAGQGKKLRAALQREFLKQSPRYYASKLKCALLRGDWW